MGFGVVFRRFFGMMRRMNGVALRDVSVMSCFFVVAGLMVLGRFMMVARRVFVVLGCLAVMFCCLMAHGVLLAWI